MIRFGVETSEGPLLMIGLTDLNVRRLTEGKPLRVPARDFAPPEGTLIADAKIVVFHATREACLEIAGTFGIDEKVMLDMLGEG